MKQQDVFIFVGPTLSLETAQKHLDACYLPPVKLGDVYRICELFQPRVIGIVDGYFNQAPAVWHKELLDAMDRGIKVYGAASMGALRAAELDAMGMRGCGVIYEAYRSGFLPSFDNERFEDDDEVAVIHGPAELGYPSVSEAMVNIRVSLAKAHEVSLINQDEFQQLIDLAKSSFYPERSYTKLFESAIDSQLNKDRIKTLQSWLQENAIDQKKRDAITLLNQINSNHGVTDNTKPGSSGNFELTHQWQSAIQDIDHSHRIHSPALNELRLRGVDYTLALENALNSPISSHGEGGQLTASELTALHDDPTTLEARLSTAWLQKFSRQDTECLTSPQFEFLLHTHLVQQGKHKALLSRAERKKQYLAQLKRRPKPENLSDLDLLQLSDWYFREILDADLPDDLGAYAEWLDLEDIDAFYAMILDEYLYTESNTKGETLP